MNPEKWRVAGKLMSHMYVWGIYPPQWDIEGYPLLWFMTQRKAFAAAFDRAQFVAVPPQPVQRNPSAQA